MIAAVGALGVLFVAMNGACHLLLKIYVGNSLAIVHQEFLSCLDDLNPQLPRLLNHRVCEQKFSVRVSKEFSYCDLSELTVHRAHQKQISSLARYTCKVGPITVSVQNRSSRGRIQDPKKGLS